MLRSIKKVYAVIYITIALSVAQASAQNVVDVYFITGQSNGGNFGELNSNDVQGYNGFNAADFDEQADAGFDLTFGRIRDRTAFFSNGNPRVGGPVTEFVENFSSNLLDPVNYAVDNFAVRINAEFGNDIGIFSYGRNGRPLANNPDFTVTAAEADAGIRNDNGESWDPDATGELYDNFVAWSNDRIAEIEADGSIANVRGIIWFQGEEDALNLDNANAYQTNFENLVAEFRTLFNAPELPIVASEIRDIDGNDAIINAALNAVAAADDFVTVIDISNTSIFSPEGTTDVHLNAAGQYNLSAVFANELIALQGGTVVVNPTPPAGLSFVADVPETVLFGTPNGEGPQGSASTQQAFGFRNADAADVNGTRTRGQSFTFVTGDGLTHAIGSLSVSLNNPISNGFRPDGQLELTVFEWDSSAPGDSTGWVASSGGTFGAGHVELFRESFPVLSTAPLNNGNLVQITFAAGDLQLTDGTAYGFLFRYTLDELVDGNGDPLSADVTFPFDTRQDNNLDGFVLSTDPAPDFADAPNNTSNRDMNFFFTSASDGVVGDFNGDGFVNCDDIDEYRGILNSPATAALTGFDLEADGTIDFADVENFIENVVETTNGQVGTFVGDLNCDGQVSVLGDALILVSALGAASDSYSEGDANLDGTVNVLGDAILLISNLGSSNAL